MKEHELTRQPHLEALHSLIGIPFRENLSVRSNKEQILEGLGFSKGTNVAIKREFILPETDEQVHGMRTYVFQQLKEGRFLSMLFKDGNWEAMGGAPVTYIMSEEDSDTRLVFDDDKLVNAIAHNGNVINIDHKINLQTYSRRKSMSAELSGFDNYNGPIPVRLGGGFRLQVDNVAFIDGQPCMTLSGSFSFNDMGSRVLELSSKEDYLVPKYETTFVLKIDKDGQLILPESVSGKNKVGIVVNQVVSNLFKNDSKAISNLLRGLLSVRPAMKVHQLEGIFSIPSETEISAEVIDFDGIDSFDIKGQNTELSIPERLLQGQLSNVDYLLTKPDDLLSYITFRKKVQEITDSLLALPNLGEDIKAEISQHVSSSFEIFSREQTGAVKLGRLLKDLNVGMEDIENPNVKLFKDGDSVITMVSIDGYDLAFWKKGSTLVDCTDIRALTSELSKVVRREIVPAHLSNLKEGD